MANWPPEPAYVAHPHSCCEHGPNTVLWVSCLGDIECIAQGKAELSIVEQAEMNENAIEDSFVRVGYHQDAEYAVNEQIK